MKEATKENLRLIKVYSRQSWTYKNNKNKTEEEKFGEFKRTVISSKRFQQKAGGEYFKANCKSFRFS